MKNDHADHATDNLKLFWEKCREYHLKITPQRTIVYEILTTAKGHPSTDSIYQEVKKRFPSISFDTVNRTLITFSEIGIIGRVEGHGDSRRFDINVKDHHHFYCINCGKIVDFFSENLNQIELPSQIEEEFIIMSKRLVLKGYCPDCKKEK